MRIVCVGGGPAGLYSALLLKSRCPSDDVTVLERNRAGTTHGWGVVFWDDLLDTLYRNDAVSARALQDASHLWVGQQVHLPGGRVAHLGGYGYSIGRARLLEILAARATAVGVDVRYETSVDDPGELADADLVIAADGVGSVLRDRWGSDFGTTVRPGRNRYIWLGTDKIFDAFTFAFEQTPAGPIWFHAYPSARDVSTLIVECPPETWEGLGFGGFGTDEGTALLEEVFAAHLAGHHLLLGRVGDHTSPSHWQRFRQVTNATWRCGSTVLVGDAAHTTHFSVGAGTKLALNDAVELADRVAAARPDLPAGLAAYDGSRRVDLAPRQAAAQESMEWFERLALPADDDVVEFAFALWSRRGDYPAWRHGLHLATQYRGVRLLRSGVGSARRLLRARRRERDAGVAAASARPAGPPESPESSRSGSAV